MRKITFVLIFLLGFYGLSAAQIKNKYHFTPFLGYFMFDKQRHIDSGLGGGINFGYFTSEKFGLDFLFGFLSTKNFNHERTVFAISLSFIKVLDIIKKENVKTYITYGFGGNKNVGFFFGLTGGIGIKYFYKQDYAFDLSARGFYLWNGRLDGIITAGISYFFK